MDRRQSRPLRHTIGLDFVLGRLSAEYQELLRDSDFTPAVKTIAEQCSVDVAGLKCQAE
jgi:hypothetical protein